MMVAGGYPRKLSYCPCYSISKGFGMGATGAQVGEAIAASAANLLIPGTGAIIQALFTPNYNNINASNIANLTAQQMQTNLSAWQNLPIDSQIAPVQQFFIQNYNTLWNALYSACSNPSLGVSGQNCISQREPSGEYPFSQYYLAPIQNTVIQTQTADVSFVDPLSGTELSIPFTVASPIENAVSSLTTSLTSSNSNLGDWLLIGGAALALLLVVEKI